jgi:hypothetical protein
MAPVLEKPPRLAFAKQSRRSSEEDSTAEPTIERTKLLYRHHDWRPFIIGAESQPSVLKRPGSDAAQSHRDVESVTANARPTRAAASRQRAIQVPPNVTRFVVRR